MHTYKELDKLTITCAPDDCLFRWRGLELDEESVLSLSHYLRLPCPIFAVGVLRSTSTSFSSSSLSDWSFCKQRHDFHSELYKIIISYVRMACSLTLTG